MRMAVNGAGGAMGRRIVALAKEFPGYELVAALERPGHTALGKDAGALAGIEPNGVLVSTAMGGDPDVLIDFSSPGASVERALECSEHGVAVVLGTTGLTPEQVSEVRERVAPRVPVLIAPNMSLGVNLLFRLAAEAARALGAAYDVEIIEAHHRRKVDAPSGTAMELARRICEALERDADSCLSFGRQGAAGPRKANEVGVHAVRGGDIVGDHTVLFAGDGERIELTHRATSRDIFARGALRAAGYVAGCKPGMYSMRDVTK